MGSGKALLILLFSLGGMLVIAAVALLSGGMGNGDLTLIYYRAQQGNMAISVTERGNLESQDSVEVLCMVDDVHGDDINGTPIVWVIPNGAAVKKGELLVELDEESHRERLDRQILGTDKARAGQIKAKVKYENRITQNKTSYAEGNLKVELAKIALDQFGDEEAGTFQISLQDVELQIQVAHASGLIEETNLEGVEQLYSLGYRSHGELAEARLSAMRTKSQLASAIAKKRELLEYEYKKQKMELEGKLASSERGLEQIERDNASLLEQARATMEAADQEYIKENERRERYLTFIENCKIYAPQDGMVAYAGGGRRYYGGEIRAGSNLRYRQKILTLPNLSKMQIKTSVHESVLDQIQTGLKVDVRIDAFPNLSYQGSVKSIAVLPDQGNYMSSDTKVYETVVTIEDEVDQIKPGMTAVVEIHIDYLKNVISLPVQAIVQIKDQNWVYADRNGSIERQDVVLGKTNEKFVEIISGIFEGDRVVLNPMAIIDEAQLSDSEMEDDSPSNPIGRDS